MHLTESQRSLFVDATLKWYDDHGRNLPWRKTTDPYKILVSEIMLQQTQVPRVIPKYEAFLERFPAITALASAPLADVLTIWTGLGYNRRAKFLQLTAKAVVESGAKMPQSYNELLKLPGIGPYTAGAICAFAYNQPQIVIDANVKRIINRVFGASEKEIPIIVEQIIRIVPKDRPRDFYNALMDISSRYYTDSADMTDYPYATFCRWHNKQPIALLKPIKQSKFLHSNRWYRGQILKMLAAAPSNALDRKKFAAHEPRAKYNAALIQLKEEGMVRETKQRILLGR